MTTKTKNLILIILATIIFALLFIPGFYVQQLMVRNLYITPGHVFFDYTAVSSKEEIVSFINTYETFNDGKDTYLILTTAILLSIVACIALYIVQYVVKSKSNWIIAAFAPILPLMLICIYTPIMNVCCEPKQNELIYYPEYEKSVLFYIVLVCLVSLLVVSISGYFMTRISTSQELEQYKVLLDQGIITQEEFDAKKKQLLGL